MLLVLAAQLFNDHWHLITSVTRIGCHWIVRRLKIEPLLPTHTTLTLPGLSFKVTSYQRPNKSFRYNGVTPKCFCTAMVLISHRWTDNGFVYNAVRISFRLGEEMNIIGDILFHYSDRCFSTVVIFIIMFFFQFYLEVISSTYSADSEEKWLAVLVKVITMISSDASHLSDTSCNN